MANVDFRQPGLCDEDSNLLPARIIFTVCAGRSGQSSLSHFFNINCAKTYAGFEVPDAGPFLPGRLGKIEQRFRRRFVQTHELLGRGRVLTAFENYEDAYLASVARKRLRLVERDLRRHQATVYVDVSKYFARGLHVGFLKLVPRFSLILLVRDPILNMRSFLNRKKNFFLDNNRPDAERNLLRLPRENLSPGELYLWGWFEQYLRGLEIAEAKNVDRFVTIRNTDINDNTIMTNHMRELGLEHGRLSTVERKNSNFRQNFGHTTLRAEDVETFEGFLQKVPDEICQRIPYLSDYRPSEID